MTYEEIEAEVSRFAADGRRPPPAEVLAVYAAFPQHTGGMDVVARCPHCAGTLCVTKLSPSA